MKIQAIQNQYSNNNPKFGACLNSKLATSKFNKIAEKQILVGTSSDIVQKLGKSSREIVACQAPHSSTIMTQLTQTCSPTRGQLVEEAKAAFSDILGNVNNVINRIKNPSTGETIGIQFFEKEKTARVGCIENIYKTLNQI